MQELVFLLVLMVMTGLGVRVLLMQLDRRPHRLPRFSIRKPTLPKLALRRPGLPRLALRKPRFARPSLPRLRLPSLKRPARRRRTRAATPEAVYASAYEDEEEDDELGHFDLGRSPFVTQGAFRTAAPAYEPEADDEVYEEDDSLPLSQIDFFSDAAPQVRVVPLRQVPAPQRLDDVDPLEPLEMEVEEYEALEEDEANAAQFIVQVPAEEAEKDPNDILSFFEKAASTTQLPETLRDAVEPVSAAELLAEAREISKLIQSRRHTA